MTNSFFSAIKATVLMLGLIVFTPSARPYIVGVDISWVQEEESVGVKYFHDGRQMDIFQILKEHGVNFIRWRTFVNPCAPDGYARQTWNRAPGKECWCDLEHTIAFAKRIKAAGMGFLHDYHMSDTWASIGEQHVPSAWAGMNDADMRTAAYNYVKKDLEALIAEGLRPDMVQVGNEINSQMSGVSMSNQDRLAALINAGVKAVRDVDPTIKVIMQHGRPRPDGGFANWYNFIKSKVDFDFIGGSTYGTTNNGQDWRDMFGLAVADGHKVLSLEYTAQRTTLINTVMSEFPKEMGLGTFVWEPTSYPQDNSKYFMFDHDGNNYRANGNLDSLLSWSKKLNATLPDWVQTNSGPQYGITTSAGPGGTVSYSPSTAKVAEGKKVEFTAVPLAGWEFAGWSGDHTGKENPYTILALAKEVSLNATFKFISKDSNIYEGENTKLSKAVIESEHAGFSGTGYANLDNASGSSVEFDVVVAAAGEKNLIITYANGAMDERTVSIYVNGKVVVSSFGFTPLENWDTWSTHDIKVQLASGINTITMTSMTDNGGPNIDRIVLSDASTVMTSQTKLTSGLGVQYNPLHHTVMLGQYHKPVTVNVFSITGQKVFAQTLNAVAGPVLYELPVGKFQQGVYLIQVTAEGLSSNPVFKLSKIE